MLPAILFWLALTLFALSAGAWAWSLQAESPHRARAAGWLLGGGAGAALALLAVYGRRQGAFPAVTVFQSLVWLAVLLAGAGVASSWARRGGPALGLGAAAAAAGAMLAGLLVSSEGGAPGDILLNARIGFHIACMMLAYAAFALACLAGALFLWQSSLLKRKRALLLAVRLPSLETLDALEVRAMAGGFALFTVGLLVGYLEQRSAEPGAWWRTDPKVLWTAATWAVYLGVLVVRRAPVLRGRRAACLTVASFAFVLFTYLGANYLSAGFHNY